LSVPDEGYSRNASCALNMISTFLFIPYFYTKLKDLHGSMSSVVGLPNNSYNPITNTAWIRARLCKLQKIVHSTRSRKW